MAPRIYKILFFLLLTGATHQSLVPKPAEVFIPSWDKGFHAGGWAVLSFFLYIAYGKDGKYAGYLAALFIYSAILESAQIMVPGRFFSWLDMLANGTGCLIVYMGVLISGRAGWNEGGNHSCKNTEKT